MNIKSVPSPHLFFLVIVVLQYVGVFEAPKAMAESDKCSTGFSDNNANDISCLSVDVLSLFELSLSVHLNQSEISKLALQVTKTCYDITSEIVGPRRKISFWNCVDGKHETVTTNYQSPDSWDYTKQNFDWKSVSKCKVTYYRASVETYLGSYLRDTEGWGVNDFPKIVMDSACHVEGYESDSMKVYQDAVGKNDNRYFFYINKFDHFPISINAQPEPYASHAQWLVTERASFNATSKTSGCITSNEMDICFSNEK